MDVPLYSQLEAVSDRTGQWLVAVAAQRAENVQEPGAVRVVVAEQG
jgi:hypothetical protein